MRQNRLKNKTKHPRKKAGDGKGKGEQRAEHKMEVLKIEKNMKAGKGWDVVSCISKEKLCYIQCYEWKETWIMEIRIKD